MKKYLLSALALPLLFACSSEDYLDQKATDNDQFAGIEKVDATFSMADSPSMRMANNWSLEEGDVWGFAWMTDAHTATPPYTPVITINGKAYQNHNLIQEQENGTNVFKPQTSIYVGKYYLYRPYDEKTVSPQAINFKSLEEQPLADGYASTTDAWKAVAKTAINIGDKFTEVTPDGHTIGTDPTIWDNAGTKGHYKLNGAMFSNQTGLDLTYQKNNVEAPAAGMHIAGATDIDYTIAAGTKIGAADIYEATVKLEGAAKSFTYAPTAEPNNAAHSGTFWADKSNLNTNIGAYFTWADAAADVITLKAADEENGVSTDKSDNKGWFWFNSLPVTAGNATTASTVDVTLTTSYGVVTINSTVGACAYAFEQYTAGTGSKEWIQLAAADVNTTTPKTWNLAGAHNTFINQYGDHKGKYALTADFSTGVMNNMHIKNDTHLQKLLKYYIAASKNENVTLNLDADANGEFKLSKISIALIQTIQAAGNNVKVRACTTHGTPKIIVTQDGQTELGLADKKEVPSLVKVFKNATNVYLSSDCEWTWGGGTDGKTALKIDGQVSSITNEGTLTVNATNVELSLAASTLENAAGATMNITKVTTVKNNLTNFGTINVGDATNTAAELRAYGKAITNDATALNVSGTINNYGVVGVSAGTGGAFNNYGVIDMKNNGAITLLSANQQGATPFTSAFAAANKMGTVVLPENNPTALVSVTNAAATGFIKYNWTGATYATPEGNVKYNTIVVSNNITFTAAANEIQFIEFNGNRTQVVNPAAGAYLPNLKGVIVNAGKSIILEATNELNPSQGVFLGAGATVYRGGAFTINGAAIVAGNTTNYLGTWSLDQIVEY